MNKPLVFLSIACFSLTLTAQAPWSPRGRFGSPRAGGFGIFSSTVVTGAPFSATSTLSSQQTLANGTQISNTEQSKLYRDAQGRTRIDRTITPPASSGKPAFTETVIVDPVAGNRYMLNSSTLTAVQIKLPPPRTSSGTRPTRPSSAQIATTDLGTQTVNGVSATGTQVTDTIPAGQVGNSQPIQIVRITWVSTDLKIPVEVKTTNPRTGNTDLEVSNIVTAAPDPNLFTVPSNYTVTTGGRGAAGPNARRRM
jgi:hypothetical protein